MGVVAARAGGSEQMIGMSRWPIVRAGLVEKKVYQVSIEAWCVQGE